MPYQNKERRPKPRGRHPDNALSAASVRSVATAGRYCDGQGHYLHVDPSGSRRWIQRLVIRGRKRELGLGGFPLVSLKEARALALANRRMARSGGDPLAEKRRARTTPTFMDAAARVLEQKRAGWRNPKHALDWPASLERYVFPTIGQRRVSEVTSADVLQILGPIWHEKPETARRVRQRISAVMQWAVAMEFRADDPCDRVGVTLGRQRDVVQHMRALPHGEVAAAIETVRASGATAAAKLRVRVPRADGGAVRRGPGSAVIGDRPRCVRLDGPRRAHEGEPQPRGPAVSPRQGGPGRRARPREPQRPRVPQPPRPPALRHDAVEAPQGARDRRALLHGWDAAEWTGVRAHEPGERRSRWSLPWTTDAAARRRLGSRSQTTRQTPWRERDQHGPAQQGERADTVRDAASRTALRAAPWLPPVKSTPSTSMAISPGRSRASSTPPRSARASASTSSSSSGRNGPAPPAR